jgi:hypothetical protein
MRYYSLEILRIHSEGQAVKHGIWNLGILESWNPQNMLSSRYYYYTYATYCSACDNLILSYRSRYTIYVVEFN